MIRDIIFWLAIAFLFGITFYMAWCLFTVGDCYDKNDEEYLNEFWRGDEYDD